MKFCKKARKIQRRLSLKKNGFCAMAFGVGRDTVQSDGEFKKYVGIASVGITGVNTQKDGNYLMENGDVPSVRLTFNLKTYPTKESNIEANIPLTIFIRKSYRKTSGEETPDTKYQVIDKYGNTSWATKEQIKNHEVPNKARLDKDFRPILAGEEALTKLLKTFLNIPDATVYKDGEWIPNPDVDDFANCEARLDSFDKLFKGDFSELQNIVASKPNNRFKVLFGVNTNANGNEYQTAYTNNFYSNNYKNYNKIDEKLQADIAAGAYKNTHFEVCPLKEYVVEPTNFDDALGAENPSDEMPFDF